jgi:phage terminase large subunit-like protein
MISHVGTYSELEAQMCQMTAAGYKGSGSPDRVDALVWGFKELFDDIISVPSETVQAQPYYGQGGWMGS